MVLALFSFFLRNKRIKIERYLTQREGKRGVSKEAGQQDETASADPICACHLALLSST